MNRMRQSSITLLTVVLLLGLAIDAGAAARRKGKGKAKKPAPVSQQVPPTRTAVTLSWEAVPGAVEFEMQIAQELEFEKPVVTERVKKPGFRWENPLPAQCYWRVRGINAEGQAGLWSKAGTIESGPQPSAQRPMAIPAVPTASPPAAAVAPVLEPLPVADTPATLQPATSATAKTEVIRAASSTESGQQTETAVDSARTTVQEAPTAEIRQSTFPLTAAVEVGTIFPQVVSKLGTSFNVLLEVGYLLPFIDQRIQVFADFSYTQPAHRRTVSDARLVNGGSYSYDVTERQLFVTLGGLARLYPPRTALNFYGQLGARMNMQRSDVVGEAGEASFGKNQETRTQVGVLVAGGVEYTLGPGALAAEIDFTFADLNHRITGNASAGGLGLNIGYHLMF